MAVTLKRSEGVIRVKYLCSSGHEVCNTKLYRDLVIHSSDVEVLSAPSEERVSRPVTEVGRVASRRDHKHLQGMAAFLGCNAHGLKRQTKVRMCILTAKRFSSLARRIEDSAQEAFFNLTLFFGRIE